MHVQSFLQAAAITLSLASLSLASPTVDSSLTDLVQKRHGGSHDNNHDGGRGGNGRDDDHDHDHDHGHGHDVENNFDIEPLQAAINILVTNGELGIKLCGLQQETTKVYSTVTKTKTWHSTKLVKAVKTTSAKKPVTISKTVTKVLTVVPTKTATKTKTTTKTTTKTHTTTKTTTLPHKHHYARSAAPAPSSAADLIPRHPGSPSRGSSSTARTFLRLPSDVREAACTLVYMAAGITKPAPTTITRTRTTHVVTKQVETLTRYTATRTLTATVTKTATKVATKTAGAGGKTVTVTVVKPVVKTSVKAKTVTKTVTAGHK